MTRTVRLKEIDGKLMFEVPKDIVERLKLSAGDDLTVTGGEKKLTAELVDERVQRQLEMGRRIIKENRAVLSALAK